MNDWALLVMSDVAGYIECCRLYWVLQVILSVADCIECCRFILGVSEYIECCRLCLGVAGYIGCYPVHTAGDYDMTSTVMTVTLCREVCFGTGSLHRYQYAALNGDECHCFEDFFSSGQSWQNLLLTYIYTYLHFHYNLVPTKRWLYSLSCPRGRHAPVQLCIVIWPLRP